MRRIRRAKVLAFGASALVASVLGLAARDGGGMSAGSSRRTRLKAPALVLISLAAVVLMLVVNPAEAFAGEAKVDGSTLVYSAGADEANNVEVYHQGSDYKIFEGDATLSVGSGCSISAAGTAVCNGTGITKVAIDVGPRNDSVFVDEASVSVTADIEGGSEDDLLYGGAGNDVLYGSTGNDELHGRSGNDSLVSWSGNDTLYGDAGDDILDGGRGNHGDTSTFLPIQDCPADDDVLNGGAGSDTADYSGHGYTSKSTQNPSGVFVPQAVGVSLDDSANDGAIAGCFTPATGITPNIEHDNVRSDVEHVVGSLADDTLTGNTGANVLEGKDGQDTLDGLGGLDTLDGGDGNDTLKGKIVGCGGLFCLVRPTATLDGGPGIDDTVDYSANADPIDINLDVGTATVGRYHDDLFSIEDSIGGSGDDTLTGDGFWNALKGGGGKDVLNGGASQDELVGGDGDDTINSRDGASDTVRCDAGSDTAVRDGSDTLTECEQRNPVSTSAPTISGTAVEGETLTASTGGWEAVPAPAYSYQWRRCDASGGSCADISGAMGPKLTLAADDIDSTLRVVVTASNTVGSDSATSAATTPVVALPPANTSPPTISGTPQPGQTLTASPGTWASSRPVTYSYRWQRCTQDGTNCADVLGGTNQTYTVVLADVDLKLRVIVTATNSGGSTSADSQPTSTVVPEDTTEPGGSVVVNGGAAYTRRTTVNLTLSASDPSPGSGVSSMRISNDGSTWSAWERYATTRSWTLSSGDGTKTVFVQYKDGAGNVSTTAQDAIKLDTAAPIGKVTINGGASITTSRTVTLALKATDPAPASGVAYMRFRNGGTTTWSNWFAYATSKPWTLTTGAGTKTVYAQFKDRAGNISATASDTITFRP